MPNPSDASMDAFMQLPEDKQRKALSSMSVETKQSLLTAIKSRPPKAKNPPVPEGASSRFGTAFGASSGLRHPIDAIVGLYGMVRHPVNTYQTWKGQEQNFLNEAKEKYDQGNYVDAATHLFNAGVNIIPGLGVSLEEAGKKIQSGDIAGGLGAATGIAASWEAPKLLGKGLSAVGKLKSKVGNFAQKGAQFVTKTGAEHTTKPIVEEYLTKTGEVEKRQAAIDASTEATNRARTASATKKNASNDALFKTKATEQETGYQESVREAGRKHESSVSDVEAKNDTRAGIEQTKQRLTQQINSGSRTIGDQVKAADARLRQEGNALYNVVSEAVAQDEGVSSGSLIEAVKEARKNIIEGKKENIPQFSEIMDRQPQSTEAMENAATHLGITPEQLATDPAFANIVEQIQSQSGGEPKIIKFKDLKGYSSELGAKIAAGPKPGMGDVYRAYKFVKSAIDSAKQFIAERAGVSDELATADHFWNQYLDTFYDKDSAVAKVRESVGVKDPEFYHEPLVTGKSAQTGISKLRNLESANSESLNRTANLAETLRQSNEQLKGLPSTTQERLPTPEEPAPIEPPSEIVPPKQVEPKIKTARELKQPEAPTAEDIMGAKNKKISEKSAELGGLRRYDLMVLLAPLLKMPNIEGLAVGAGAVGLEKLAAASLKFPKVMEWITRVTPEDIAALDALPDNVKIPLKNNLSALMKQPKVARSASPVLTKFLQGAGLASPKPVQNRQEAKDRLNSIQK